MKPMKANEDKLYIITYCNKIYYIEYITTIPIVTKLYYMNVGNFRIKYNDSIVALTYLRGLLYPYPCI